jgi:hypothetical protein
MIRSCSYWRWTTFVLWNSLFWRDSFALLLTISGFSFLGLSVLIFWSCQVSQSGSPLFQWPWTLGGNLLLALRSAGWDVRWIQNMLPNLKWIFAELWQVSLWIRHLVCQTPDMQMLLEKGNGTCVRLCNKHTPAPEESWNQSTFNLFRVFISLTLQTELQTIVNQSNCSLWPHNFMVDKSCFHFSSVTGDRLCLKCVVQGCTDCSTSNIAIICSFENVEQLSFPNVNL